MRTKSKATIKKTTLIVVLMFITFIGFSQTNGAIEFNHLSGYQTYCSNNVPSGTFQLQLYEFQVLGGLTYTYTWQGGAIPANTKGLITPSMAYPTTTTTYKCIITDNESMQKIKGSAPPQPMNLYETLTFTITVTPFVPIITNYTISYKVFTLAQLAANPSLVPGWGYIYLSNSQSGVEYTLYCNGSPAPHGGPMYGNTGYGITFTGAGNGYCPGKYTVYGYWTGNGCGEFLSGSCIIPTTGGGGGEGEIKDNNFPNTEVKVYPNPSNGNFTIETSNAGNFILLNALGQELRQIKITPDNNTVEIKDLKAGMYFLKNVDNNNFTSKIVVMQ